MGLGKLTIALALSLLLIGLEAGFASGETERLEELSSFDFDYRGMDLAWDGEHLWATNPNEDKIYKIDTSGNIISSFDSPAIVSYGLTWDGEYLWVTSVTRNRVYKIDTSGRLISSFGLPSDIPYGLTWDGEHLWVNECKVGLTKIIELDTSGNVISSFNFGWTEGLAWDGEHLWAVDGDTRKIYKLDTSGNVISSFDPPSSRPQGLAWEGEHLWVSDVAEGRIYQLRVTTDDEAPSYTLNVFLDPTEGGSVTLDPSGGTYPEGTVVTLTADPAENYQFAGWSGDASGTSATVSVTMDSDKQATANFSKVGEGGEEEGLPVVWICVGIVVLAAIVAGILVFKRG